MNKQKNFTSALISVLIISGLAYLILGTGLHGDDYIEIVKMSNFTYAEFFYPSPYIHNHYVLGLPAHYFLFWAYKFLGYEYLFAYDLIKVLSHGMCIWFIFKFLQDYLPKDRALLGSVLFILYPLHDSTTYWYMALVYIIPASLIAYSCHLLVHNAWIRSFIVGLIGATFFYTSPPFTFGLGLIFLLQKNFKKFCFFILPGFIYVFYYLWIRSTFPFAERRINSSVDLTYYLKNLVGQIVSTIDSFFGPSFFLKIYYSIMSIEIISLGLVSALLALLIVSKKKLSEVTFTPNILIISIFGVVVISMIMFASTGQYNHSPFNLGNRTLIYTSFLAAVLIAAYLPSNRLILVILVSGMLLPIFGISDYWKSWNNQQKTIINSINSSKELLEIKAMSLVIIEDNLYHKLGPFDHIEFFSMPWNVRAILEKYEQNGVEFIGLNSYLTISEDQLIDAKYLTEHDITNNIYLYNSYSDQLRKINALELEEILSKTEASYRHWIQGFKGTKLEEIVIRINPRLSYIFK
jgi:hypothetical protein